MTDNTTNQPPIPEPAEIQLSVNGETKTFTYEDAFAAGCSLLRKGNPDQAAIVFSKLQKFMDRGPRAGIMRAFCESAQKNFSESSQTLQESFPEDSEELAQMLHDAFVYYHVVSRDEGIKQLVEIVNDHKELPTLCLLLGDMLDGKNPSLAMKCWKLAVRRDSPEGSVAKVAQKRIVQRES